MNLSGFPLSYLPERKLLLGDEAADDVTMKDVAAVGEDAHCVFNVNSYQMVFVANNESFLYKRHAFTRAKQVSTSVVIRMGCQNII